MHRFLLHSVGIFLQFINLIASRSDVSAQLLDFVVKHEFELFQLLGFLLQVVDSFVLITNCQVAFVKLFFLRLEVSLEVGQVLY